MEKHPRRWLIAIVSCIINLCLGVNYAWSVLSGPLAQRLNDVNGLTGAAALSAGSLAIVFSLTNAIMPVPMIAAGAINDRHGPRAIVFAGGILFGTGLLLTGMVASVGGMILTYSIMVGIGNSLVYTCTVNNTVKFFPDKKGLIGGLTSACYGVGSIVFSPLTQAMVAARGVTATLRAFGIVIVVVICGGSFFLAKCPRPASPAKGAAVSAAGKDDSWNEMLRTPVFYVMLFLLACGSLMGMMVISQASAVAQEMTGVTPAAAAIIVSLISAFNTSGRLISGYASDRFGRINVITAALLAALAGLLLLYASAGSSVALFAVGVCLVGLCFGSYLGVYPGLTADHFGIRNNTLNYGLMFLGNSIGAIAGPALMNRVHNTTGMYRPAFLIAAALAAGGVALTFVYRKIVDRRKSL